MNFDSPQMVESIAYDLKLGNWPRALNRARINDLANGKPPYTPEEVQQNNIVINVNDLECTRATQHARSQFYSAFLKPAHYFSAKLDSGPKHKRQEWNTIGTSQAARVMKRSLPYFECQRSKFALDVLHGIGPSAWEDRDKWCPDPMGVEDVLVPADTLLTMKNLPFFFVYKSWTAPELIRLTTGPNVDPGWNLPLVQSCIRWMDTQMSRLRNNNWPQIWSPEKQAERIKSDGGWYAGDQAPRIDCFDFYFWRDDGRQTGWRRRVIIDPWSTPVAAGQHVDGTKNYDMQRKEGEIYEGKSGFLFNPGKRKYADRLSELVTWQFADLSAVGPFRYHSVRSLGYLLFAVCHLQNRLRCQFNKHVFESLMQYFRGASEEDYQRALKVELFDRQFIEKSIEMIPPSERWQINAPLAEMGLNENRQLIAASVSAWSQNQNFSQDRTEKTKFQVMAEVSAMTSMISAALLQAFRYAEVEYQEIWRRLCRKNSRDKDVREFRANCLRLGIPEEYLEYERWEIQSEQVMGAGNKTMELAIAEQLLQMRNLYDPGAQREILRDATLLITDDAARTRSYVPDGPRPISDSQHDAQLSLSVILMGKPVAPVDGQNHKEIIAIWIPELARSIKQIQMNGAVASPQELVGLKNLSLHIKQQIAIVAQDEEEQQQVKQWMDEVGKLDNYLKAFEQRLMEMQKQAAEQQQASNGGLDPKTAAEIQGDMLKANVKADNQRQSAAQRRVQRDLEFQDKLRREQQQHQAEMAKLDLETAQELRHEAARHVVGVRGEVAKTKAKIQSDAAKAAADAKATATESSEA